MASKTAAGSTALSSTFDLSMFDSQTGAEEGRLFHPTHPRTGEPLIDPAGEKYWIRLHGANSAPYRNASKEAQEATARKTALGLRNSMDENYQQTANLVIACTIAWHLPPLQGEPLLFSDAAARSLFSDRKFATLMMQAKNFIDTDLNFFPV